MRLVDEFSVDNFRSYARGCIEAAEALREAHESGCDAMIMPSRGAYPITQGVIDALSYEAHYRNEAEDFVKEFKPPGFLALRFNRSLKPKPDGDFRIIPYPLTADTRPRDRDLRKYRKSLDEVVDDTRRFGSYVISKFFVDPEQRAEDPYFNFLLFVHKGVEGRRNVANYYSELEKIEQGCILDTAISGRAVCTISSNLYDLLGEEIPHLIVIVDKEGAKLRKSCKSWLMQWVQRGKARLILIKRILTEDRGAALLGIVGVIYPTLAFEAERRTGLRPLAAVTWHVLPKYTEDVRIREYNEAYDLFRSALKEAIKLEVEKRRVGSVRELSKIKKKLSGLTRSLEKRIGRLVDTLQVHKLLSYPDPEINPSLFTPFPVEEVNETSAHVIHLYFGEELVNKFVREFASKVNT